LEYISDRETVCLVRKLNTRALIWLYNTGEDVQERAFPATIGPEDCHDLTRSDFQIEILQDWPVWAKRLR